MSAVRSSRQPSEYCTTLSGRRSGASATLFLVSHSELGVHQGTVLEAPPSAGRLDATALWSDWSSALPTFCSAQQRTEGMR